MRFDLLYKVLLRTVVGLAVVGLAACAQTAPNPDSGAAQAEPADGGEASVPYADSRFHYRIDAPGHMASNADGTASFAGPSERLEIAVVQGSPASDPKALAGQDAKTLAGSLTGFRKLSAPGELNLNGVKVVKFIYAWSAGTSSVTGKATELTSARYYIPKDGNTVAVVTYSIVTNQYDPEGADDLARTFRWQ